MKRHTFYVLIAILLQTFSASARAADFWISRMICPEGYGMRMACDRNSIDIHTLAEINERAHILFPMNFLTRDKTNTNKQNELSQTLAKRLHDPEFKAKLVQLRTDLSSFLVSGGLTSSALHCSAPVTGPAPEYKYFELTAFNEIKTIHPLLFLLTRLIITKANDDFYNNINNIFPGDVVRSFTSAIRSIVKGQMIYANTEDLDSQIHFFQHIKDCALRHNLTESDISSKCDSKETNPHVSVLRKFSFGSILLRAMDVAQIYRKQSSYEEVSVGDYDFGRETESTSGNFSSQMALMRRNSMEKGRRLLEFGMDFLIDIGDEANGGHATQYALIECKAYVFDVYPEIWTCKGIY